MYYRSWYKIDTVTVWCHFMYVYIYRSSYKLWSGIMFLYRRPYYFSEPSHLDLQNFSSPSIWNENFSWPSWSLFQDPFIPINNEPSLTVTGWCKGLYKCTKWMDCPTYQRSGCRGKVPVIRGLTASSVFEIQSQVWKQSSYSESLFSSDAVPNILALKDDKSKQKQIEI